MSCKVPSSLITRRYLVDRNPTLLVNLRGKPAISLAEQLFNHAVLRFEDIFVALLA